MSVKVGAEVVIPCEAEGYPEPIITWKRLDTSEQTSFYDNKLHILSATYQDSGNYECTVKNSEGDTLTKMIAVSVIGKNSQGVKNSRHEA